jgi:hypothetical protein
MAGYSAIEVFGNIEKIAHSSGPLDERRQRAQARIDQFGEDLANAQHLQPGTAAAIARQLKAKLERVTVSAAGGDIDLIFRAALDQLTGKPAEPKRKAPPEQG